MADKNSPIGVFDSGIGGLTILKKIRTLMKHEDIIYFADTASCPYGERSREEIIELSRKAIRLLIEKGVKVIVIACNTASTTSSAVLRHEFSIPIIATEPAVKPAVENTKSGIIGVLATRSTIESGQIDRLALMYGKDVKVIKQIGHSLVDIVEGGKTTSPQAKELLESYISP
ncbi:MAG: glutamate racemase, partial [Rikenellaceae bacterium]